MYVLITILFLSFSRSLNQNKNEVDWFYDLKVMYEESMQLIHEVNYRDYSYYIFSL